jgi:acetolactate synthase-1/2/3 large subunit
MKNSTNNKDKKENDKLHMEEVLDEIYKQTLDKDVMFTTGVGNHQMQTYQFIKSQYPNKIISSGSLGVMGAGLPYAIGSQLANPDKLIINIDGDSSFNMTLGDLKTVIENRLPLKIAIMNNSAQMMVTIWEKLFFNERYTATLNEKNPNYLKLADSYGIKGLYCDNISNLKTTINEFINYDGPILCEFKIKKDICLPLVGPGKALDDMILEDNVDEKNINLSGMAPS